ncbi:hypothetical protein FJZ48_02980, partial [Candidatus Uhrbacteria bacterium]|nr:hypothetical protein [Candidatus Uhrbacteria bacterium]
MSRQQTIFLTFFLGVFLLVTIGFFWQEIARTRSSFLAGTNTVSEVVELPDPTLPAIRPTDPTRGDASTKAVTIVTFADFSCLYCRLTEAELQKSLAKTKVPFRVVWRDFPVVKDGPEGLVAAIAGRCAKDQGKFWQMHDALFQIDDYSPTSLKLLAGQLNMNVDRFAECSMNEKHIS